MDDLTANLTQHKGDREEALQRLEQLQREFEEAKRYHPVYLYPKEVDTLQGLAMALGAEDQQGQASVSALCQWLAVVADAAWPETVAALQLAKVGYDGWQELAELINALFQAAKEKQ